MGGPGSGRRAWTRRPLDSECLKLDIKMIQSTGAFGLEPDQLFDGYSVTRQGGSETVVLRWQVAADDQGRPEEIRLTHSISDGQEVSYEISLTSTRCNFGGIRSWFVCPAEGCGRRVGVLYLTPKGSRYECRHCAGIAYASTRQTPEQRQARRATQAGIVDLTGIDFGQLPAGTGGDALRILAGLDDGESRQMFADALRRAARKMRRLAKW